MKKSETSPSTYQCNLCKITYEIINEKDEWKSFISGLPYKINFLHRNEFNKKYPMAKEELPAVFEISKNKPLLVISADEINKCRNVSDLKNIVASKLNQPRILKTKNK